MAKKPNNFVGIGGADGSIITSVPKDFKATGGASIGTGAGAPVPPITTKGEDFNPDEPDVPGTFGETPTGRPNAVTRGGRTFFIQGSDLELFQQQQDAKDALSGGQTQGLNPRNTIAQNQQIASANAILPQGAPSLTGTQETGIFGLGLTSSAQAELAFKHGLTQEEIVRFGLTPLDMEVLQSGEAEISGLSRIVEGIPILGKLKVRTPGLSLSVADFFGDSPETKVEELIKLVKANTERAELKRQLAVGNPALARHYKDQIEELFQMNLRLESRIKLLSLQSPAIQGSPDKIIQLQGEIQDSNDTYNEIIRQLAIF